MRGIDFKTESEVLGYLSKAVSGKWYGLIYDIGRYTKHKEVASLAAISLKAFNLDKDAMRLEEAQGLTKEDLSSAVLGIKNSGSAALSIILIGNGFLSEAKAFRKQGKITPKKIARYLGVHLELESEKRLVA